jgi:hydroxymethylglutaryl-CoA lyase
LIKIIETPRDAFQGIKEFIPTEKKIKIIDFLLKAGFDTVEAGSFVSEKVIPQMADTAEVLRGLDLAGVNSKIMVLVGNRQGGVAAGKQGGVDDILYPASVSRTFLKKNLNIDPDRSRGTILDLMEICELNKKRLVVYLTMAFGNPYGDKWDPGIVEEHAGNLYDLGLRIIPLSDILGEVTPENITRVYTRLIRSFPDVEFGFHLHSIPGREYDKIDAAWKAGVRRFDTVTGGFGGCPMADDHLVGNLDTFALAGYCEKNGIAHGLDVEVLRQAATLMNSE